MFLKRLESVGFKSFAERIDVSFVPGVTAIVGPNGSGKSNITDAIRWVLGEQSAHSIRGAKMEDIIFQGSDSRKPLNVAEVTLVLDNTKQTLPLDYKEVSVTRRVFRSGESEFYINKQTCRLKDIVDLFMDSGLGRESFSIISQGKVEDILSSKAEERRVIFEEAAGVLKYKQRKKKSEFKLAETEENLYRVDDIIHELEAQLEPLEKQAQKAETYINLKNELKEQEISFLITEIDQLHQAWQKALEQLDKEKMEEIKWKTSIQQKEAQLEQDRNTVEALDEKIEALQADLLQVTQELEQYEGKKSLHIERYKHHEDNKEKLEKQKSDTAQRIQELNTELEKELNILTDLQATKKETDDKVKQLKNELSLSKENILDEIEELKSIYIEYLNEQAAHRNEKNSLSQQVKQLQIKKKKHQQDHQELQSTRETLVTNHEHAEKELSTLKEQFVMKQNKLEKLKKDLEDKRDHYQSSQTKLYQGYQHIEKMKSKKEMLEEMKEDFQGFYQGVKAILKARERKQLKDIHGAVLELIDIPKQYVTAVETVLGGQAQYVVVSNEQSARTAINYLKKSNSGRATFLPLHSISARFIPAAVENNIKGHDGFVGIAAELVQTDAQYDKVLKHLMGHVIVVKTLKDANEIASLAQRRYRVVTLEGDVVNPGGSMSGGARQKRNSSLFTREKDLQEVSEKLVEFNKRADQFSQQVAKQKEWITEIEDDIEALESDIGQAQQVLQHKREYLTEVTMRLQSLDESLEVYHREQAQFQQDEDEFKKRETTLTTNLEEIDQKLTSTQTKIDELTTRESQFQENRQQMQEELHRYQVMSAEQIERLKHQQEKSDQLKESLAENEALYESVSLELKQMIELEQNQEPIEVIHQKIDHLTQSKQMLLENIQGKRSERANRTKHINDQELELKEENKQHQAFLTTIQQGEVNTNRMDVELENRLSQLQTDYEITYERAKEMYETCDHVDEVKAAVATLKDNINRLGTVNLGAIEEYERVSERYTFLTEQKEDLMEAKQTLYTAIAEMDEEMERLFDETFSQVKEEFSVVFKELFGGGYAELKLTDPNDLLHTGVEIIAQPPGKKLQQLGLLSGGERALTAIALLFSILRVRPVPFCVLDEVEAALDEANVDRYARYVKSHSKNTQFIVITHRKGTMEEADVLYGVTMQESGVSRFVSVRLEETAELIES